MNWKDVKHFTQGEWGPNSNRVSSTLIFLLDDIRHQYGKPIIVHCAYASKGHSPKSWHYERPELNNMCGAVDFHFEDNDYGKQFELISSHEVSGGIGFYGPGVWAHPGFHLDIRPKRTYWTERNGVYVYGLEAIMEDLHGK